MKFILRVENSENKNKIASNLCKALRNLDKLSKVTREAKHYNEIYHLLLKGNVYFSNFAEKFSVEENDGHQKLYYDSELIAITPKEGTTIILKPELWCFKEAPPKQSQESKKMKRRNPEERKLAVQKREYNSGYATYPFTHFIRPAQKPAHIPSPSQPNTNGQGWTNNGI